MRSVLSTAGTSTTPLLRVVLHVEAGRSPRCQRRGSSRRRGKMLGERRREPRGRLRRERSIGGRRPGRTGRLRACQGSSNGGRLREPMTISKRTAGGTQTRREKRTSKWRRRRKSSIFRAVHLRRDAHTSTRERLRSQAQPIEVDPVLRDGAARKIGRVFHPTAVFKKAIRGGTRCSSRRERSKMLCFGTVAAIR